jgi:hypothetical protein
MFLFPDIPVDINPLSYTVAIFVSLSSTTPTIATRRIITDQLAKGWRWEYARGALIPLIKPILLHSIRCVFLVSIYSASLLVMLMEMTGARTGWPLHATPDLTIITICCLMLLMLMVGTEK